VWLLQEILELGCGWGSFSLFAAAAYPKSKVRLGREWVAVGGELHCDELEMSENIKWDEKRYMTAPSKLLLMQSNFNGACWVVSWISPAHNTCTVYSEVFTCVCSRFVTTASGDRCLQLQDSA
jgi:hypothetical protein